MLPKYEVPHLTNQALTDDILNAALESENYIHVSVQTARNVCYMYMSHTAVWDEELEKFRQEAAHDRTDNFDPLDAVATLTKAVEDALMWEEIRKYRQQSLKEDKVAVAMNAINLKGSAKTMTLYMTRTKTNRSSFQTMTDGSTGRLQMLCPISSAKTIRRCQGPSIVF